MDEMSNSADNGVKAIPISGWAKFMAVLNIIGGALSCLSIIGAIVGVPIIIAGLKLMSAVEASEKFSADANSAEYLKSINDLNSFFKINGIITVVYLCLFPFYIIFMMTVGIGAMAV